MDRKKYLWFYLNQVTGANAGLFERITAMYPDLEELYECVKRRESIPLKPLGQTVINRLFELADEELLNKRLKWIKDRGIDIIPLYSEAYPSLLKEIKRPPSMLYVKGKLQADIELPIGMVGMRRHTAYGEMVATHLSSELVKHGATIISGMALGIDACAARAALRIEDAAYPTVAVLGSGIEVIYPSEHARLYDEIAEKGAVISEFLPGTRPLRENFPIRNRVISGLSRGVVVVEAGSRSGTAITANHALEQGRDVFAVPGRITDESSVGPNRMIQRGEAKPVFCAADILVEYGIDPETDAKKRDGLKKERRADKETINTSKANPDKEAPPDMSELDTTQRAIVEQLASGNKNADELCDLLSLDAATVNSNLTSLQFSGIIKQLPGRMFGI